MIKKRQEIVVILTLREINLHWVKMLNSRILYVVSTYTRLYVSMILVTKDSNTEYTILLYLI